MVNRAGERWTLGKNMYTNIEICNYLNMKQKIDLRFYIQQLFQFFLLKEFLHTVETHFLQRISQLPVSLKYDAMKKKQTELKYCEIFFRKYFKSAMWVMILYDPFSCSFTRTESLAVKKENSLHLFHNFLHWFHKPL